MSILTEASSSELVVPIAPTVIHRTVEYRGENNWQVQGWSLSFPTAFAAMTALREETEREARHPVRISIRWKAVPSTFVAPTTGTSLL